jgi:predicted lactoylglutathione lyase
MNILNKEKTMSRKVFINIPVSNLSASTAFYESLGFTKNPTFSDDNGVCVVWSDEIYFMLLKRDFYKTFIRDKDVIDTKTTSGVLVALTLESKEAVQEFADKAKQHGGDVYTAGPEVPEDMMFGYEVSDLDGNILEPLWMNPDFTPHTHS